MIAPVLYMTKSGYDDKIRRFVKSGGTFITTFFSGIVDEHDLVITGGYPGKLRDILGIWAEEIDALPPDRENSFIYKGKYYPARLLCDLIHLEGAEEISAYQKDFYAQMPAVTVNNLGKGRAYYIATSSSDEFYNAFLQDVCKECGITSVFEPAEGVEATVRENENGSFLFLLNHNDTEVSVSVKDYYEEIISGKKLEAGTDMILEAKDVRIWKKRP